MVVELSELLSQFANTFAEWHALVFGMIMGTIVVILYERYDRNKAGIALLAAMFLAMLSLVVQVDLITGEQWYYLFGVVVPVSLEAVVEAIERLK